MGEYLLSKSSANDDKVLCFSHVHVSPVFLRYREIMKSGLRGIPSTRKSTCRQCTNRIALDFFKYKNCLEVKTKLSKLQLD